MFVSLPLRIKLIMGPVIAAFYVHISKCLKQPFLLLLHWYAAAIQTIKQTNGVLKWCFKMKIFLIFSDLLNCLRNVYTISIRTENGLNSIKVISSRKILTASRHFNYLQVFLIQPPQKFSSSSDNINNTSRTSRLSYRFLSLS